MLPFKKYKAGYIETAVFPLEYIYITQGEDGSYSHKGSYAIDFAGRDAYGTLTRCPYYAPCDLKLVATPDPANHLYIYESIQRVYLIDGSYDYITLAVAHDDDSYTIGRTVLQGELLGKTGTYGNVTGDHVHMEGKKGLYEGMYHNNYGTYMLVNEGHLYDILGTNDTIIERGYGYNWRNFDTIFGRKKHFPWFIYYGLYAMK